MLNGLSALSKDVARGATIGSKTPSGGVSIMVTQYILLRASLVEFEIKEHHGHHVVLVQGWCIFDLETAAT
jgi:hypothetical protein